MSVAKSNICEIQPSTEEFGNVGAEHDTADIWIGVCLIKSLVQRFEVVIRKGVPLSKASTRIMLHVALLTGPRFSLSSNTPSLSSDRIISAILKQLVEAG